VVQYGGDPNSNKIEKGSNKGIIAMFIGSCFMAIMSVFVKLITVNTTVPVMQICFFRSQIMFLGTLFHAKMDNTRILSVPHS
jgi:hypothetical protein